MGLVSISVSTQVELHPDREVCIRQAVALSERITHVRHFIVAFDNHTLEDTEIEYFPCLENKGGDGLRIRFKCKVPAYIIPAIHSLYKGISLCRHSEGGE